jgi:hypothetical protein
MKIALCFLLLFVAISAFNLKQVTNNIVQISQPNINTDQQCIMDHCTDEINVCTNDPNCMAIFSKCQDKCGGNQGCWAVCIAGGNHNALNLAYCAIVNGCM